VLLALDAGNSNITIALLKAASCAANGGCAPSTSSADEWGILLHKLFSPVNLNIEAVDRYRHLQRRAAHDSPAAIALRYFHTEAVFVGPKTDGDRYPLR